MKKTQANFMVQGYQRATAFGIGLYEISTVYKGSFAVFDFVYDKKGKWILEDIDEVRPVIEKKKFWQFEYWVGNPALYIRAPYNDLKHLGFPTEKLGDCLVLKRTPFLYLVKMFLTSIEIFFETIGRSIRFLELKIPDCPPNNGLYDFCLRILRKRFKEELEITTNSSENKIFIKKI